MRMIPKEKKIAGLMRKLVERTEKTAIYAVYDSVGNVCGYETHIVRISKAMESKMPDGHIAKFEAGEILASTNEFGTYAWAFPTLETAKKKQNELISQKRV